LNYPRSLLCLRIVLAMCALVDRCLPTQNPYPARSHTSIRDRACRSHQNHTSLRLGNWVLVLDLVSLSHPRVPPPHPPSFTTSLHSTDVQRIFLWLTPVGLALFYVIPYHKLGLSTAHPGENFPRLVRFFLYCFAKALLCFV
jgi:hypothetical protein